MVTSGRTSLYFDLLDGFKKPRCPICRYALRAVERFFESLTYENTNDPGIRDGVRAARGFCNRHTLQYLSFGDELGTALIYRDLLHTILPAIEEVVPDGLAAVTGALTDPDGQRGAERTLKALAPTDVCIACQRLHESEEHYLTTFLQHLNDQEFVAAFKHSTGLCTVHAGLALHWSRGSHRDLIRRVQQRCWAELLQQLDDGIPDAPVLQQALVAAVGGKGIRP
ncbi:MAG: DUF6062 family protein [Chloroflexi bacterium]|nr:DUF6062 family protein [Chloroflexota bacterium]